jgi:hypothetical protein
VFVPGEATGGGAGLGWDDPVTSVMYIVIPHVVNVLNLLGWDDPLTLVSIFYRWDDYIYLLQVE